LCVARPDAGAIAAAVLTPFALAFARFSTVPAGFAEVPSLVLVTAWLLRDLLRPSVGRAVPGGPAAFALGTIACASTAISIALIELYVGPDAFPALMRQRIFQAFFTPDIGFRNLMSGALLLEGIAVYVVVARISVEYPRFRRWFVAASVVGGIAAVAFTLLKLAESAGRHPAPVEEFFRLVGTVRFDAEHGDVNAAGSHYVLLLFPALAGVLRRQWTAGAWALAAAGLSCGIVVAGSRVAVLSAALAAIVAAILWAGRIQHRPLAIGTVLTVIAASAAAILAFPKSLQDTSTAPAILIRRELARVALVMTREHPVFGVGVGEFHRRSSAYIVEPKVKELYPSGENAHNNFLQILAELGIIGLAAFLWLLTDSLRRARASPADREYLALIAGLGAFLLTCVGGHPLLVREPAFAFWSLLAVASTWAPWPGAQPSRWRRRIAIALAAAVILSLPFRIARARAAFDLEHAGYDLGEWQRDPAGLSYRAMRGSATMFAPADASVVEIATRLPPASPTGRLRILVDGRLANEVVLSDAEWRPVRVFMVPRSDARRFVPIEFQTAEPDRVVWLGKIVVSVSRNGSD
jgi:O-antigen ligase/polysaccharide polymerase Wzy-like membrane protein